jgi:hypothetical protein
MMLFPRSSGGDPTLERAPIVREREGLRGRADRSLTLAARLGSRPKAALW